MLPATMWDAGNSQRQLAGRVHFAVQNSNAIKIFYYLLPDRMSEYDLIAAGRKIFISIFFP